MIQTQNNYRLVLERANGGSLSQLIGYYRKNGKLLSDKIAKGILRQIIEGFMVL
jgi:serine/threonine protein kinase